MAINPLWEECEPTRRTLYHHFRNPETKEIVATLAAARAADGENLAYGMTFVGIEGEPMGASRKEGRARATRRLNKVLRTKRPSFRYAQRVGAWVFPAKVTAALARHVRHPVDHAFERAEVERITEALKKESA
jgi:hypothetical protein